MSIDEFRKKWGTEGASIALEIVADRIKHGILYSEENRGKVAKLLEDLAKDLQALT